MARRRGAASPRIRGAWKALRTSLAVRCLTVVVAYALVLVVLLGALGRAGDALLASAFPSMEMVFEHEDALEQDDFTVLQSDAFRNCQIIIFNDGGTRLYATSEKVAGKVRASDLSLINDYDEDSFYEVFQERTEEGLRYRVLRCSYDRQDGYSKTVDAWCVLDEGLDILAGDLFADRDSLTQREFDLIKGVYDAQLTVERYDYVTVSGASRTLVLLAPMVSDVRYQQALDDAGRITLLGIPVMLVATGIAVWLLMRLVRRAARPLDAAIDAYRRGGGDAATSSQVPSELARTYDNFVDLMDQLAEARLERQRIIADVSHDLKTPLTVIRGYAQAFCEGRVPAEKADGYHRAMYERASAAGDLIDTLFSYATMEHPDYEPHLVPTDVCSLVRSVADDAAPAVEQAGCTLEVAAAGELRALVDDQLFRRMLVNLIDNAWSHNEPGIRIRVACEQGEGGHVEVTVADTGQGFSPELAARAFEPFVTENTARAAGGGTGLGLSIARRAVELMGGCIRLDDGPASPWSTVLVITLPLHAKEEKGSPAAS